MKAMKIFIIKFCAALLLTTVPDGVRTDKVSDMLHKLAKGGVEINKVLKPLESGSLGSGGFASVYRAEFIPRNNTEVAMKIWEQQITVHRDEYEMYTYLDAINNPNVTGYGIPAIYYYGTWNVYYRGKWDEYTIMAMTLLHSDFMRKVKARKLKELDLLFLFREFVRIIKYVHSRGVIKRSTTVHNIMIQNGQGFMISFHYSMGMFWEFTGRLMENIEMAKSDFTSFLHTVLRLFVKDLPASNWHWLGLSKKKDAHRMVDCETFAANLEVDAQTNKGKEITGLERVFAEFLKHSLDATSITIMDADGALIPFHDQLYRIVNEEIQNIEEAATSSIPSLSDIQNPFDITEWEHPAPIYNLFEVEYAEFEKS